MLLVGALVAVYALTSFLWAPGDHTLALIEILYLVIFFAIGRVISPKIWLWFLVAMTVAIPLYAVAPIINPDYLACVIALACVVGVALEQWPFVLLSVFGLWYTADRTAILAAGIGSFYLLVRRFPAAALCGLLCLIPIVGQIKPTMAHSFFQRVGIWQDTLNHTTFFGHGFGSFHDTYLTWLVHTNVLTVYSSPAHAYSDVLELISDLGIATIPLWIFIAYCLRNASRLHIAFFLCFAVLSLAYFPLWIPPCPQLLAIALGQASIMKRRTPHGTMVTAHPALSQRSGYA